MPDRKKIIINCWPAGKDFAAFEDDEVNNKSVVVEADWKTIKQIRLKELKLMSSGVSHSNIIIMLLVIITILLVLGFKGLFPDFSIIFLCHQVDIHVKILNPKF